MTDDQIIEMAKQCGSDPLSLDIFAFARLIEASVREECAALCEGFDERYRYNYGAAFAAAIRGMK